MNLKIFFRDFGGLNWSAPQKWQLEYLPEDLRETSIADSSQEPWLKSLTGQSYQDREELDFQSFWRDTEKIVLTRFWLRIMELTRTHLQNIAQRLSGTCFFFKYSFGLGRHFYTSVNFRIQFYSPRRLWIFFVRGIGSS